MTTDAKVTEIHALAKRLLQLVGSGQQCLPLEIFHLISNLTPMVIVDLLIRNKNGQNLLTWRSDELYGPSWHISGGIIRFKESTSQRIATVAAEELGCTMEAVAAPLAMREPTRSAVRGHFISLLFPCTLTSRPDTALKFHSGVPKNGKWMWHDRSPDDLIRGHEAYLSPVDRRQLPPPAFSCMQA